MSPASTETIQVGALGVRFLVEAADSNGSASVFECFVPADSKMPAPHSHDAFEETIYGLEGTTTWTVDGRTSQRGPRVRESRDRGRQVSCDIQPRPDDAGLLS
jgi:quercetin dioxygenase-like cupin family protein